MSDRKRERVAQALRPQPVKAAVLERATPEDLAAIEEATRGGFGAGAVEPHEAHQEPAGNGIDHDEEQEVVGRETAAELAADRCDRCISFKPFPGKVPHGQLAQGICNCNPPLPALVGINPPKLAGMQPTLDVRPMWPPVVGNWSCRKFKPAKLDS